MTCFRDVGNRIPHLGKASDVATEELGWLLGDVVEIMLSARSHTCSHVIVSEDFLQLFPRSMESRAKLVNQLMAAGVSMTGR